MLITMVTIEERKVGGDFFLLEQLSQKKKWALKFILKSFFHRYAIDRNTDTSAGVLFKSMSW